LENKPKQTALFLAFVGKIILSGMVCMWVVEFLTHYFFIHKLTMHICSFDSIEASINVDVNW
jgi:hypothetical protein